MMSEKKYARFVRSWLPNQSAFRPPSYVQFVSGPYVPNASGPKIAIALKPPPLNPLAAEPYSSMLSMAPDVSNR